MNLENYRSVCNKYITVDIKSAPETLALPTPPVEPLWPPFWNKGEICILFSETNVGKSILAVQIADDISRGESSVYDAEITASDVVYFDYELSDIQFKSRYKDAKFRDNFFRATPFEESVEVLGLENAVADIIRCMESGHKVIIVDNITFLSSSISDATQSLELMKLLKAKTTLYGCSLLIIAHTPKRQPNKVITKADLAGSSNILNFSDSAFAMGNSYLYKGVKYIKQIKVREGEFVFDEENVLVGNLDHIGGMLRFVPVAEQREALHIM